VRFSELDGKRIGVWGAGREIVSFAQQLHRRVPSARIVAAAFDAQPPDHVGDILLAPDARVLTGTDVLEGLLRCDVVVRSPGVSTHREELVALRERGVAVTTATGLWLAQCAGERVIGVTGTKGKSTTTALIAHLARAAGQTVALAGNIGVPALDLLDEQPAQVTVLELSSYQIADLEVGPEVAVVTNVYREHTDWHGSEEAYREDKLRLLGLAGVRAVVRNARDERLAALALDVPVLDYGQPDGWDVTAAGIALAGELRLANGELPLRGEHNALNLCAALTALRAFDVPVPPLGEALAGFRALPHRLESVCERDGVLWVNDSISTTPESTMAALESFPGREVVLIAGGQDRGQDYAGLARALSASGASVIAIPTTGTRLLAAAREADVPAARALPAADLGDAVRIAGGLARAGSVVLLSPAAPSFDHYRDFEERGERFRTLATR
jgi:UDP-N-acetylmuramoyl-L-alanine---L-glutamate ligase